MGVIPGEDALALLLPAVIALGVGAIAFFMLYPVFSGQSRAARRVARIGGDRRSGRSRRAPAETEARDQRRKAVQDTLKQIEERERQRRKRLTLRAMLAQAGFGMAPRIFWLASMVCGIVLAALVVLTGSGPWVGAAAGLVGAFGLPRWLLSYRRKRRQNAFLTEFPNAIDIMVRGLKAGLPVTDTLKIIASECPAPVGPEFREVVETQRLGVPLDQSLERLAERVPLAEVNFLYIVISIQQKTGGNLSEALSNLSRVLRDRTKMKGKIRAMSQEAKSSAWIIGSLPPLIMLALYVLRPDYITTLWTTPLGQILLMGSALWMLTGVLVMRKMVNFDF